MTAQCQSCAAPSPNAFLCKRCTADLRQLLADLPWWLERLAEAAVGQVRFGSDGRSSVRQGDELSKYIDPRPEKNDQGMLTGRTEGQRRLDRDVTDPKLIRRLLAAGGVNADASARFDAIQNTLSTWVRDAFESRGLDLPPSVRAGRRTGVIGCVRMAVWLRNNLGALTASEDAGRFLAEMRNATSDIERAVNRPIPWKWLGPCPTWMESRRATCGHELKARADAIEVVCRGCRATHNCNRLQLLLVNDLERSKVTIKRILELNRVLPEEYRIPERTLRRWRTDEKLRPKGYVRASDGRQVITRHSDDDEPLYLWSDVRKLRVESGRATG